MVGSEGFHVDNNFIGHGIGRYLHQYPQVHHTCTTCLTR